MRCEEVDDALARLLDNTLPPGGLSELEAHRAVCAACDDVADFQLAVQPGDVLGRFRVEERVGAGGMGEVFAAHDPELDRRVAIKVLRGRVARTSGVSTSRQRLAREARAMARLSHPNTVTVFDVGESRGRLYLAMEFVDGPTLEAWLQVPGRTWRDITTVFCGAARGLAAAHAAGITHRDFKPSNVLLTAAGVPKVTDFGLATGPGTGATPGEAASPGGSPGGGGERSPRLTTVGAVLGTPRYMAPEQVAGQVSPRADQYSLCVALHEALFGTLPADGPPPTGDVPARVRATLARGLESDPGARLPTMDALVAELEAALAPRWSQRKVAALAAGGALLAAFGGLATWRALRPSCGDGGDQIATVQDAARLAAVQAAFERTGMPAAREIADRVTSGLAAYAGQWSRVHREACEAAQVRAEVSPAVFDRRRRCLDAALADLGALTESLTTGADVEVVSRAVQAVSSLPPVTRCAEPGVLEESFSPPAPAEEAAVAAVRARIARGRALALTGRTKASVEHLSEGVAQASSLRHAAARAELHFMLGRGQHDLADYKASRTSLELAGKLAAAAGAHRLLCQTLIALAAGSSFASENKAEGLAFVYAAELALRQAGDPPKLREDWLGTHAYVLSRAGDLAGAAELDRQALELCERTDGKESQCAGLRSDNLGNDEMKRGRYAEALALHQRALAINVARLGAAHPLVGWSHLNLGIDHRNRGELELARASHERALAVFDAALGPESAQAGFAYNNLGNVENDRGELEAAWRHFEHARAIRARVHGEGHPRVALVDANLGYVRLKQARLDDAEALFRRSLAAFDRASPNSDQRATPLGGLASVAVTRRRWAEALGHIDATLAIWKKGSASHPQAARPLVERATCLLELGRVREARQAIEEALRIDEAHPGPQLDPPHAGFVHARVLWAGGADRARAVARAREALAGLSGAKGAAEIAERREVEAWLARHGR